MKKIITSFLTFALVLCCFTFVGCKDKDNTKPATIEGTLEILDQFIADMQAVGDKISADGYTYPTNNAIASSIPVRNTDKSSIGIEYSNYTNFDYDYDFSQDHTPGGETSKPSDYYSEILGMPMFLDMYFDIYKDNNLQLNKIYKIYYDDGGENTITHFKLTNDNSAIYFSTSLYDSGLISYSDYIINLNSDTSWKSIEIKLYDEEGWETYIFIEKTTNINRLFDRYLEFEYVLDHGIDFLDLDETTQKMIYIDNFKTDSMNIIESKVYNYLERLNIKNIVDNINTENAVEIEINIEE